MIPFLARDESLKSASDGKKCSDDSDSYVRRLKKFEYEKKSPSKQKNDKSQKTSVGKRSPSQTPEDKQKNDKFQKTYVENISPSRTPEDKQKMQEKTSQNLSPVDR